MKSQNFELSHYPLMYVIANYNKYYMTQQHNYLIYRKQPLLNN